MKENDIINVNIYGSTQAKINQINGDDVFITLLNGQYKGECFIRSIFELVVK